MIKRTVVLVVLLISTTYHGLWAQKPNRIITAGSVLTEIVCELGHCKEIVASDQTSTYPPEIKSLPSIGYRTGIGPEGILSQDPTLILVQKGYVRETLADQLANTGVAFYQFEKPVSLEDTKKLIVEIGTLLGEEAKANALIARMDKELSEVKDLLKKTAARPKVVFIYARGAGTQMIAGKETFTENLIRLAGGEPAVDITGYKPLNTEALIVANPDYLLFGDDGLESVGGMAGASRIPGVDQTNAGRKQQIIALDMVMMSNFGPRLPRAVKALALMIHPEIKS